MMAMTWMQLAWTQVESGEAGAVLSSTSAANADWHLYGPYYLADPKALIALPILALIWLLRRSREGGFGRAARGAARMPLPMDAGGFGANLPRTWRQRLAWLPGLLLLAAVLLACAAMARPVRANVSTHIVSEGVDVALILDRSSSMRFPDMEQGATRLDVVKEVVQDFVVRRTGDSTAAADKVGLVGFAGFPELLCPFTLDSNALVGFLEGLKYVEVEAEDGTALGRALAKAVALLRKTDAKSKVAVLLTDGRNTVFDIAPLDAAQLAAEEGIKVYTILVGRYQYEYDAFRGGYVPTEMRLDTSELEAIAELTGGEFYEARDKQSLEAVYERIEELEKTERRDESTLETFDLYPRFLWPALWLYLGAWLCWSTWARRLT